MNLLGYGFTTSDLDQRMKFTGDEVFDACLAELNLSDRVCADRVLYAIEMANYISDELHMTPFFIPRTHFSTTNLGIWKLFILNYSKLFIFSMKKVKIGDQSSITKNILII